jgi:SsrA-binding protein
MTSPREQAFRKIAVNRRALHDYFVLERLETGIELRGTEVKSVRDGHISLVGAHALLEKGALVLFNVNIAPYEHGNRFNHDPDRPRRLLCHRREIRKLEAHSEQQGHALIPLSVYFKRGFVKIELGICKGKREFDKRETIRTRTADRDARRAMANARR